VSATTAEVWKAFGERLGRFIRKRVRNDADADDLLQEILTKIHVGLKEVEDPAKLEAWLFQVARRAILDHFRARSGKKRSRELPLDLADDVPAQDVSALVASWLEPLMEGLSPEDQETLRLTDLEGLPQKDLAERLGISATGARSRVQRARERLKGLLEACCHVEMDRRGSPVDFTPKNGSCGRCDCP
jgi:RNA polymerase sigma-70 factor (ECF subfamily)